MRVARAGATSNGCNKVYGPQAPEPETGSSEWNGLLSRNIFRPTTCGD